VLDSGNRRRKPRGMEADQQHVRLHAPGAVKKKWKPADDYRPGIFFQLGVYRIIDDHRGNHSRSEMKHLCINCRSASGKPQTLVVTRSHFEDLGMWVNVGPKKPAIEATPCNYDALFGADGRSEPMRRNFSAYRGGITVWPTHENISPESGLELYYSMNVFHGANTSHHAWYRFVFPMDEAWITFQTKQGVALPEQFRRPVLVEPSFTGPTGREIPSLVLEEYGIPPKGDDDDTEEKPQPPPP
jgi:hypothetical protein